mmetsp:Transcript_71292/g.230929  ORF Transcript_71292/g.230929 Transcript_71292/m.230929 type:complete len:352 (-) Transcript_71292:345-1400(-)
MQWRSLVRSSKTNEAVTSFFSSAPPTSGRAVVASGVVLNSLANICTFDSSMFSWRYKNKQDAMNLVRSIRTCTSSLTVAKSINQTSPCESSSKLPPCRSLWQRPSTTSRSNFRSNVASCATKLLKKSLMVFRVPPSSLRKAPVGSRLSMSGGFKNPAPRALVFSARFAPSFARLRIPWPTKRTILYIFDRFTFFTERRSIVNASIRRSKASFTIGTISTFCVIEDSPSWMTAANVCTGGADANSGSPNSPPHKSICITAQGSCGSGTLKTFMSFTLGVVRPKSPPYCLVLLTSSLTFSSVSNFRTEDGMGVPSFLIGEKKNTDAPLKLNAICLSLMRGYTFASFSIMRTFR